MDASRPNEQVSGHGLVSRPVDDEAVFQDEVLIFLAGIPWHVYTHLYHRPCWVDQQTRTAHAYSV